MSDNIALAESGVLLVDKPEDWTSHDVVNFLRRRFGLKKVGHCGTLDPIATGLLVLVLGRATKLSERFMRHDKVYSGTMCLGVETASQDRAGEITAIRDWTGVSEQQVRQVAAEFVGRQEQIPPMVSAVKVNGKKLYQLARKGKEVERSARQIVVHELVIGAVSLPEVEFRLHCSKGTYVRTLCADIGTELGCGAHVKELRRLRSGPFEVTDAVGLEEIRKWEREELFKAVLPLSQLVAYLDL